MPTPLLAPAALALAAALASGPPVPAKAGSDGKALAPPGTKKRRPQLDEIEAYFAARRPAP
jgi:hypothetical protein